MSATPMTLADALNLQGYTIKRATSPSLPKNITVSTGTIFVPPMALSLLNYNYADTPVLGDDLYISNVPLFSEDYRAAFTSKFLDRFWDRRLCVDTIDVWAQYFIQQSNEVMPYFNLRYLSMAVDLPLDTESTTRNTTANEELTGTGSKDTTVTDANRSAFSDAPQSQLSGDTDYATNVTDDNGNSIGVENTTDDQAKNLTELETNAGRQGISVAELLMKQRMAFINVDIEVLDAFSDLFIPIFDQDEDDDNEHPAYYGVY